MADELTEPTPEQFAQMARNLEETQRLAAEFAKRWPKIAKYDPTISELAKAYHKRMGTKE